MLLLLLLLSLLPAAEWAGGRGPGRAAPDPRFPTGSPAQDRRYWLEVQESLEVQEGLCASVPCSFLYPLNNWNDSFPVHGYWFRETPFLLRSGPVATNKPGLKVQPEAQGRFRLLGNPRDYDCSLDIRDARRSDSGKYFFRVERGSFVKYNFQWNLLSVNVTALTQTPNIHIQGLLEPGQPKNITCSVPWACKRGTAPTFSWIGDALTSRGPRTLLSSMITLIPRPQDHGTNLTCRVTFPGANVRAETSIRLNMSWDRLFVPAPDVPQNLTIHIFRGNSTVPEAVGNATSLRVEEGQSLRLVCDTDSRFPTRLSWSRGSLTLSPSRPSHPGVIVLPQLVLGDGGEFTCRAQHAWGSSHVSLNLIVQGLSCSCPHISGEQQNTWPLVLTLLRGALMGAGFLLTYGLTWLYYTRFRGSREDKAAGCN
ncbi:sialic acid-binding Ig-like lectin 14 isoform X6 [Suricata suricatta]|uniref:sialic acid-binding Ig-like lectin 14 isoform X6 n=1 Tax=Suricata suricatta TaxID=37032 RepID=UPI0011553B5C|nr:sialic acid-binding Ig-like lectin 14 isoform X6 [Suricata suricatta]